MNLRNHFILISLWLIIILIPLRTIEAGMSSEEIIVSAAASLTNVMNDLGHEFEREYSDKKIILNFGSSGSLLQQMIYGAPVDVFASANLFFMEKAKKEGLIIEGSIRNFCRNNLVLISPATKMGSVKTKGLKAIGRIAMGNPETVPAGRYARQAIQGYGLWQKIKDRLVFTGSVRQVLDYVVREEVDAGVVYKTDALVAGEKVGVLGILKHHNPIVYPIALVANTRKKKTAAMFIEFVTGERGRVILAKHGFGVPD